MSRHYRCDPAHAFSAGRAHSIRCDRMESARRTTDPVLRTILVEQARSWHRLMMARLAGRWE